jgi:RimJ/RimL family protein N-acetyltransferase
MTMTLEFRPATAADTPQLLEIFASSRLDHPDVVSRHPGEREKFIEHEFNARQRSYPIDFPGVEFLLICSNDETIGRLYIQRTRKVIFVVDLVLLPGWRGRGLGTGLLKGFVREAWESGAVVRLHVEKTNSRAKRLYERLGFRIIGDARTHHLMEGAKE